MDMDTIKMLGVVFTAIGAIGTAGGLVFATLQLHHKNRLTSGMLVADALKVFATDKDMQDMFYEVEYNKFVFDQSFFGSATERKLDKMLRHFAAVAHAWDNNIIQKNDIVLVHYYIVRITKDKEVNKYLKFLLDGWVPVHGLQHPYRVFEKLTDLDLSSSS